MKITVLGSGSAFSSASRFNSCYFVEATENRFLIDCGSDALRALQKANADLFSIQEIFITHMHADHCGGLPAVLTAMHVLGRKEPVKVYVPFTQVEFTKVWFANLFIYNERTTFEISLLPLSAGKLRLRNNIEVELIQTNHLEKYLGYAREFGVMPVSFSLLVREGGRKFFFSGDLGSLYDAKAYISDSISLVEATHPSLNEIADFAKESGKNLFFTHIPQELESGGEWAEELRTRFGIEDLNMVNDGQVLNV